MPYYFILGRENKISQIELASVLASFGFDFADCVNVPRSFGEGGASASILTDGILEIKLDLSVEEVADLINVLGGTVKIFQKIAPRDRNITDLLSVEGSQNKIIFGLSNYSRGKIDVFKLALEAKRESGKSARVIAGKEGDRLSSAQSFQYKMDGENIEYGLFDTGIGRLIAVQNIDRWTKKDYGKPRSDAQSGMLPPKLARMMVNIAIGQAESLNNESGIRNYEFGRKSESSHNSVSSIHNSLLVVDPFCGSGNILLEALSLGFDVAGSDISEKAVEDAKANTEWLINNSKCKNQNDKLKFKIERQDATKYNFGGTDCDFVIITEPYLGEPRRSKLRIEDEARVKEEIMKLYLDFLLNLKQSVISSKLKAILIIFPLFELANGKQLSLFQESVDKLAEIGYATICPPLKYGRDYQLVKRQIVLLKIKNKI